MTENIAPPPRKIKVSVALKNIHAEQITKLQNKHQQECDLLDDLRTFSKQRSLIEKEYAQALLKLTSQLQKREFNTPAELNTGENGDPKTSVTVWRVILDETEKMAKARLAASDIYIERIHEPLKQLKATKMQVLKKVLDHLAVIQNETTNCVREMLKSQKIYNVDETLSHDSRQKATDCENRLKRKSKGLFQSVGSMQRNCAKLKSRKETCEVKSTTSRNEYLFNLAASNAHQVRYYTTDLPQLMNQLDMDVYENLQEFFTTIGKTSVESSGVEQECFSTVLSQATLVSGDYNNQCFLSDNPVFTRLIQYQFEPCHNDPIDSLTLCDHNVEIDLEKEARKWATKIARENKTINESSKLLRALESGDAVSVEPAAPATEVKDATNQDSENKAEELRETIRKSETSKLKAEYRIELLREAGVNVEQWLMSAQADMLSPGGDDDITRTPSQVSLRTESSSGIHSEEVDQTYRNYDDDEDDFTDDMFETSQNERNVYVSSKRAYPIKCMTLYEFQANNPDELSIASNEILELIADGDGDGWIKARNCRGLTGFVPENYVQFDDDAAVPHNDANDDYNVANHGSFSSNELPQSPPFSPESQDDLPPPSFPEATAEGYANDAIPDVTSYTSSDYEVQDVNDFMELPPSQGQWCRAIYDYEATTDEELSFYEGQFIKIVRMDDNGVDDGWWEGEVNGRVGVFPSIVVEEVSGSDVTQEYGSNFQTPSYAPSAPPVTVTLPTPDGEFLGTFESSTDDFDDPDKDVAQSQNHNPSPPVHHNYRNHTVTHPFTILHQSIECAPHTVTHHPRRQTSLTLVRAPNKSSTSTTV